MKVERINQKKVYVESISDDSYLAPQIKWKPTKNWIYVFSPNDLELLVKNTKPNRIFLMNLLKSMKKEVVIKKMYAEKRVKDDIKICFNKNID